MDKKVVKFGDTENEKHKFHKHKIINSIKKGFDNESVYNEKYLKNKILYWKNQLKFSQW